MLRHIQISTVLICFIAILTGCSTVSRISSTSDEEILLNRSMHLLQLKNVSAPGNYALYYDENPTPEIPVHVNAGDKVGFFSEPDGRIKAIAGSFKMDIESKKTRATWKRYAAN